MSRLVKWVVFVVLTAAISVAARAVIWIGKADRLVLSSRQMKLSELVETLGKPERVAEAREEAYGLPSCGSSKPSCQQAYWYGPPLPGVPMQWVFGIDDDGKVVSREKIDSP